MWCTGMQGLYARLPGGSLQPIYIYMHCTRSSNLTDLVYQYARPLCSIEWGAGGLSASNIYICIVLDPAIKLIWSTGMQGLSAQLTRGRGLSAFNISMHCTRSSNLTDVVYRYARHLCSVEVGSI